MTTHQRSGHGTPCAQTGSREDYRRESILLAVAAIPPGRVTSYGLVAVMAGLPGRARLVGRVLSSLPDDSRLPWHRVMGAGGRLAFPRDSDAYREQRERLAAEGVDVSATGRVDWRRVAWQP